MGCASSSSILLFQIMKPILYLRLDIAIGHRGLSRKEWFAPDVPHPLLSNHVLRLLRDVTFDTKLRAHDAVHKATTRVIF